MCSISDVIRAEDQTSAAFLHTQRRWPRVWRSQRGSTGPALCFSTWRIHKHRFLVRTDRPRLHPGCGHTRHGRSARQQPTDSWLRHFELITTSRLLLSWLLIGGTSSTNQIKTQISTLVALKCLLLMVLLVVLLMTLLMVLLMVLLML